MHTGCRADDAHVVKRMAIQEAAGSGAGPDGPGGRRWIREAGFCAEDLIEGDR